MSGTTDTQSLRYGTVNDVISHLTVANLADDIAAQLDAADTARTHALKRPTVGLLATSTFSLPVSTVTVVTFNSLQWDSHSMVNLGTFPQRITLNASAGTGLYHVYVSATCDTTGWTKGDVIVQKNGSTYDQKTFWGPVSNVGLDMETFVQMDVVTDYFTFALYHEGGGSTTVFEVDVYLQKISD